MVSLTLPRADLLMIHLYLAGRAYLDFSGGQLSAGCIVGREEETYSGDNIDALSLRV